MSAQRQVAQLPLLIPSADNTDHLPEMVESSWQSDGQQCLPVFPITSLLQLKESLMNRCHYINWRKMQMWRNKRDFRKMVILFVNLQDLISIDVTLIITLCFWLLVWMLPCVLTEVWKQVVWHLVDKLITSNKARHIALIFPVSWSSLANADTITLLVIFS